MDGFADFIGAFIEQVGGALPPNWASGKDEVELARQFLTQVNAYLYQRNDGLGVTTFNGQSRPYVSPFHQFWEAHHQELLGAHIDRERARVAAQCLSRAVRAYGVSILRVEDETRGLPRPAVAQVRFFTANQDFRVPPKKSYGKYRDNPTSFAADAIAGDPEGFLKLLGVTGLSQTDKRVVWASNTAQFLLAHNINAYQLAELFGNDAVTIRDGLVGVNMGYGPKKANMFIRDMVEFGVWSGLRRFDAIDVASDINTVKLALRTGVLKTEMPLVSSFLDIFGLQYGYITEMSASAWRIVWEEWRALDPETALGAPCEMDFLLYRIGRDYCRDMLVRYECERGHVFWNFGARAQRCRVCDASGLSARACATEQRLLPCQVSSVQLPRENGRLHLKDTNLLTVFDGVCPFEAACEPKRPDFQALEPPKSISVIGRTGWETAYTDTKRGGGGLMA